MWIYQETYRWDQGDDIFVVGYFDKDNDLVEVEYYKERDDARLAVHFLNGGADASQV